MYQIKAMDREAIMEIAKWKYPHPYAIYNIEADAESIAEMLDGSFYTVWEQDMIGYFCFGKAARIPWAEKMGHYLPGYTDIGLALRPNLTGKGLGLDFLQFGLDFASKVYPGPVRLTVAAFNERARTIYYRAGFIDVGIFTVPGGQDFIQMVLE